MKKVIFTLGIISLVVCGLALAFSAVQWFLYHHDVMDGSPALYSRLRRRMWVSFVVGILFAGLGIACLFWGAPKRYSVDYGDSKVLFEEAKDSYKAGERVTLYFSGVIVDADAEYIFRLDDEELNARYAESRGYVIQFVMPDHDVKMRLAIRSAAVSPHGGSGS